MLAHRLRGWPNIETAMGECSVFAGLNCILYGFRADSICDWPCTVVTFGLWNQTGDAVVAGSVVSRHPAVEEGDLRRSCYVHGGSLTAG